MSTDASARIRALADEQAIRAQMCHYIQAIDRCDPELLKSTFHPDGSVIFGVFDGNAMDFCAWDIPFIRDNLLMGWHRVGNISIVLDGDRAMAESYMLGNAAAALPAEYGGGVINCPDGLRYHDVWEKRDGTWRMFSRNLIMDWNACWPFSGSTEGLYASFNTGRRDRSDPAYALGILR